MATDPKNQLDLKTLCPPRRTSHGRWGNGLSKLKGNRPLAFAFVVALSLCLGACGGEAKADYMYEITIGNDQRKNNDFAGALEHYSKAVTIAEKKYGQDSGQVATALGYLGQIYRAQGEWRLAYMTYKRLVPLMDKFEPNTRETKDLKSDFELVKQKIIEYGIKTDDNYGADQMKKNPAATTKKPSKKKHH